MKTTLSCVCPKCGGSGILGWTDRDGGICYKCEGAGYLGEMPEGFRKCDTRELRREAQEMIKSALYHMRAKGESVCLPSYELWPSTIQALLEKGKTFRFKYNKFWMNVPSITMEFGGNNEYAYRLIVGGEFLVIKPVKIA